MTTVIIKVIGVDFSTSFLIGWQLKRQCFPIGWFGSLAADDVSRLSSWFAGFLAKTITTQLALIYKYIYTIVCLNSI